MENEAKINKRLVSVNKPGRSSINRMRNMTLLLMSMPMLIYIFIFKYLPMGGIIIAFKDYKFNLGIMGSKWVGLDNLSFFFNSPDAWRITRNTLGYNLVFLILGMIIPVTIAILLSDIKNKKMLKYYQTTMFIPQFLSWVIIAYMAYAFLNSQSGLINQVGKFFGKEPVDWYVKSDPWIWIIIIAQKWKTLGMATLMYYSAILGIDKEFYEAAQVEGANKFQIKLKIVLPFLYPLVTMLALLNIGQIFSADFGLFYQLPMNSALLYPTTDVIDTYVFRAMKENANIGMSSAVDFYKSLMGFICIVTANLIVRKSDPERALF